MTYEMKAVFWGVLLACVDWGWGQENLTFDGDVRDFAISDRSVYVVTDDRLYQLNHDFTKVIKRDTPNVVYPKQEAPLSNETYPFKVNILLPFIKNKTLITCGTTKCGYCEILDLNEISKSVHSENIEVGSLDPGDSTIGFIVDVGTNSYIMTGRLQSRVRKACANSDQLLDLRNTLEGQHGGIFSDSDESTTPYIDARQKEKFQFVDGFQSNSHIYVFSNVPQERQVRVILFKSENSKTNTLRHFQGATLKCCGNTERRELLSSSVIQGSGGLHGQVLWAGVFTAGNTSDPINTVLAIYNISSTGPQLKYNDPDFCYKGCAEALPMGTTQDLHPEAVVFRYSSMTSVLAVRHNSWLVFFIGTGDGQLIKLAVDKAYKPACPRVLYNSDDDRRVFPKMHLDPVDRKHVYMALRNQMVRVPVAQCSEHKSLKDCWSAQDPFCGWCESRCSFQGDCLQPSAWISISEDSQQQNMVSYQVEKSSSGERITLTVKVHLNVNGTGSLTFTCNFFNKRGDLCDRTSPAPAFPQCSCLFSSDQLPAEGLNVTVKIRVGKQNLAEKLMLTNCSDISGPPTSALCSQCMSAGCSWSNDVCSWTTRSANSEPIQDVCRLSQSGLNYSEPVIFSIEPSVLSFHGRNHALMNGENLDHVTKVRIQGHMNCSLKESPVWNHTGSSLTFHIPSGDKGSVSVCAVLPDGRCLGKATVTYGSSPSCTGLTPSTTWASGKRKIKVHGSHLEFVEEVVHDHAPQTIQTKYSSGTLWYHTPPFEHINQPVTSTVSLRVANQTLACSSQLTYHPDPEFTSYTAIKTGNDMRVTIEKRADKLNITTEEILVFGVQEENHDVECVMDTIETSNETDSVICEIKNTPNFNINSLRIRVGNFTKILLPKQAAPSLLIILVLIPIIIVVIVGAVLYSYNKQRKMAAQMNKQLDQLECDIRNDIRQGFVDMQTEKCDLIENVGAIPFLDYKHFASRIFFPDGGPVMTSCIKDIGQDAVKVQPDESCQALSRLIRDQVFLTSFVHALEEQKNFNVKEKCAVASLLTVSLHGDLPYLTQVMEELLRALMEQPSNSQPKLMLRRTESIVEKLLTNWMSICLYGFLRESVGQPLFLLVCALTQQMSKGPVDSVTEKALYTLNEDWLLWQAQDFSPMRLQVLFAVGTDGEVSEPLEVSALDCDTVEQVKEKILLAFKTKFGFPYNTPLRQMHIEYEKDGRFVPLKEVDASSGVLGEVTMLNTLKHYKVPDGASIKVLSKTHPSLSPQSSLKDDQNYSTKYFHLIDPDIDQDQKKNPERKKLKLKEVYLTKLLSTKVAVHSFVENLFRTIWGTPNLKTPPAIKYFFDFLDAQGESKRINDSDVLHIWKTNSLPLRFWVNILKNPQFVFDMEKTPPLDGCLSVIAQAFMDSFSLAEKQLGKHDPTNKLLYAKDISQYKQEVRAYYKQVRDQPPISSSEFKEFLHKESKKHENEFNESAALRELYKYMQLYFDEIKLKLDQNGAPVELKEQLQHVKSLFDSLKSCSWN
ncbi:plexin-C1 isoform X2 [Oncorhynchus tshawytscha]|uniref:plexin-C1 isoform X1 n=2 Tax=Oncorhynchus tshawytscha TaxID=74940 RepID=UPI001C3E2DA1|nr:plexin-C1 isoform X1 [Oncorhynchus tshawytscha]XP_024228671.2 plexin-C1 isoform X2 [Oncorhynchus tshawytscha]